MNIKYVYLLWHTHTLDDEEDQKLIGIYSSQELASRKITEYQTITGFKDFPNSFEIAKYQIDKDYWQEGFITL